MASRLYAATLFVLYQLSLLAGILLLPLAMVTRRVGITPPVHRAIDSLGEAYEQAT